MKQVKNILVIAVVFLSGCCTPTIVPEFADVFMLPPPELVKMTVEQENSIPQDIYEIFSKRDEAWLQFYEAQKEQIIIYNKH